MVRSGGFVGVDGGPASARAGVLDAAGGFLGTAKRDSAVHREKGGMVEQSSTDVWRAVSAAVKEAVARAAVAPAAIGGIGFDATCSLVVLGDEGAPLPGGLPGAAERDIIVWMGPSAVGQAESIPPPGPDENGSAGGGERRG